jgi:hypothetical protein
LPICNSMRRKLPSIFFNCFSCFTITKVIHVHNVGIFLILKCSH